MNTRGALPPVAAAPRPGSSRAVSAPRTLSASSSRVPRPRDSIHGVLGFAPSTAAGAAPSLVAGARIGAKSTISSMLVPPLGSSYAPSVAPSSTMLMAQCSSSALAALEQQLADERQQRRAVETRLESLAALFERQFRGNGAAAPALAAAAGTSDVVDGRPPTAPGSRKPTIGAPPRRM